MVIEQIAPLKRLDTFCFKAQEQMLFLKSKCVIMTGLGFGVGFFFWKSKNLFFSVTVKILNAYSHHFAKLSTLDTHFFL